MQYFAHVKWFVEDHSQNYTPQFNVGEWLATALLICAGISVLYFVDKFYRQSRTNQRLNNLLGQYEWLVPIAVRTTTGLLLLLNFFKDLLFAPNVPVGSSTVSQYISIAFAALGVMLILGVLPRLSGLVLTLLYFVSLAIIHPTPDILDHVEYIGIGSYIFIRGGGKFCLLKERLDLKKLKPYAPDLLRIFVGIGLMVLAVTEKLQGVTYSTEFLQTYDWNFLHALGISDRSFILIAGAVEFVVGLSLVLNWAPRITTAIVLGLMIITAALLGMEEVFGHLFAVSLVAVIWLNDERHYLLPKKRAKSHGR